MGQDVKKWRKCTLHCEKSVQRRRSTVTEETPVADTNQWGATTEVCKTYEWCETQLSSGLPQNCVWRVVLLWVERYLAKERVWARHGELDNDLMSLCHLYIVVENPLQVTLTMVLSRASTVGKDKKEKKYLESERDHTWHQSTYNFRIWNISSDNPKLRNAIHLRPNLLPCRMMAF